MTRRQKVKNDAWIAIIIAAIVFYAFLADWWRTHAILGWTILVILIGGAGYVLYRYASVRGWLGRQVKDTLAKVVLEDVASEREPFTPFERDSVLKRAHYRCENESCNFQGKPHIHHIDMNNSNNNLRNLIALCPNCHQKAHDKTFSQSQLFNWARGDYKRLLRENEQARMVCPKCGGDLVKKVAKTGQNSGNAFWGCNNFPRCRYIKDAA